MAADIHQVLRIIAYRGIHLRLVDGRLVGRSVDGRVMPADMVQFIAHFKDRIVAHFLEEERLAETVTNILALTPEEQEQYRRELTAAPFDQEHIQHDREAWRRALIQIQAEKGIAA